MDASESLLINFEGFHLSEIFGYIVLNIVYIAINLNIQVIGSWSDLTFDAGLVSHKIEFIQTWGEHVRPEERKDFAL